MDKGSTPPYSSKNNIEDNFELVEHRLNASREAIRQRINAPERNSANGPESNTSPEGSIKSWSSLLIGLVTPLASNAATRHPYSLIAGSALIGAYLAWARPWRKFLGSVLVGAVVRNLVMASLAAGSKNSGRILRHYLNRSPEKKYPPYQKQEHAPAGYDA